MSISCIEVRGHLIYTVFQKRPTFDLL